MHNIFSRIFSSHNIKPPQKVSHAFEENFGQSINIEWHKENDNFEALFYIDEIEHIVLFSGNGQILEIKRNLELEQAKPQILQQAENIGELMNLIEISRNGSIIYDVIARDGYLDRYHLLLDTEGNILEKRKL